MENSVTLRPEGRRIFIKGTITQEAIDPIREAMTANSIFCLDFSEVEGVNFAAMRGFLNLRKMGLPISIVNASDAVTEKFEDSGLSTFISICRKAKPLDMSVYEEFGESFMSKAYNSADGDAMIKVYGKHGSLEMVTREKAVARAVMVFGIPTPLVGTIYSDGEKWALDFERIAGKRSLSRIISEEPERMEEVTVHFAKMCKELHATPCDTAVFSDRREFYRSFIAPSKAISDDTRRKILAFIDKIPAATTCLHGDLQPSNVITNGKEYLWIDLSDFAYGYPMMDLAMWYFLSNVSDEKIMIHLFHLNKVQMRQIWDIFCRVYFDTTDPAVLAAKEEEAKRYCILHMVYLGCMAGFEPFMIPIIEEAMAHWED